MTPLVRIKLLHTAVWILLSGCIVAIPIAGALDAFRWAAVLSGLIWLECAVLAANRCACPLAAVAARHTEERAANFDIYLPLWLARWNKHLFGTLFVAGEVFVLVLWLAR